MTTPPASPRLHAWRRRRTLIRVLACGPALALVAFVLIAPVGWLSWLSVRDANGFTLRHYARMLANPGYAASLETTLEVAALVTLLSGVLAYPVAVLLARLSGWRARLVLVIVLLPLWTSLLVRTFAWLVLLQRHGLINSTLLALGVIDAPLALVNNLTGTVIGMTHVMTPFVVLPVTAALQGVDPLLYRAARSLGANRWRAFWGVVFPLSLNGVFSGATLVFVMSLGFYVMPSFLGGGSLRMWSNRIQTNIEVYPDWGAASALGVVLLTVTIAVLALSWRLMKLVLVRSADAPA
jgi:putative spermidine/putrescine transport system permease protein/spermidine/putrescine transport system permease protein